MASNTKLFFNQKQYLKDWVEHNPTAEFYSDGCGVTVMVQPVFNKSRMYAVAISTMSPNERKFRTSVGRYCSLSNFEKGQYILMNYKTLKGFLDSIIYD